jgi:hypothetical protein
LRCRAVRILRPRNARPLFDSKGRVAAEGVVNLTPYRGTSLIRNILTLGT